MMTTTTLDRPQGLSDATRVRLRHVSIATIATLLFKRGLRNQCLQDVHPLGRKPENMVGPAFTLRYIPAREDLNGIEVFRNPDHPQRAAVEAAPPGSVLVMDSRKDPRAASAGSILVSRLMVRGVAGVVTDGGFRDSPEIADLAIHAYHNRPSAPTNLTLHQALEFDVPIGCGDVAVWPGDVLVGDGEGVIVIPHAIVDEVAEEAAEMTVYEDFVLEQVQGGATIIGLYPSTRDENKALFAEWRARVGR
jgi:regulator of RNase E activity RraA